jgi:nucleotide-binding universal stress UspA family protein
MKTIVVPTDFSLAANNAARYAVHLAKAIKSHILLCNAMLIPVEGPMADQVVWPLESYDSLKETVDEELHEFAHKLSSEERERSLPEAFNPAVDCKSEIGNVADVVRNVVDGAGANMIVMGMSGAGGLSRFFLGSKSRDMIDVACFPVLLIPAAFIFKGIKKIAFATDLSVGDIEIIHSLAGIAHCFNAEILITHITDKKYDAGENKKMVDAFLSHVSNRVNYPKIYYRHVKSMDVDHGLDWLSEHSMIDMLAMVHRPHDTLDKIFKGSHTQKLARHVTIPLLVFPNNCCAVL